MRTKLAVIMLFVFAWVGTSTALREMSRLHLRFGRGRRSGYSGGGGGGGGGNMGYNNFDKCPTGTGGDFKGNW